MDITIGCNGTTLEDASPLDPGKFPSPDRPAVEGVPSTPDRSKEGER